ncbi:MAG: hypothetical protein KF810_02700 [Rhizobiaceae bacterium]|nr:hypothetical protein [Rhizobiaceae bacterium]
MSLIAFLIGAAGWGLVLLPLHLLFVRKGRAQIAADRLFRDRVRKHVKRGVL